MDAEYWTQIWNSVIVNLASWLPGLVGALILLIVGWLLASLGQAIVRGLLRRLGLDRLAERIGFTHFLINAGLEGSAAVLLARLVYWLILLIFIMAALESLGVSSMNEVFNGLISYLPNILAAALILILGAVIARLAGDAVGAFAVQSGISGGLILGQAVRISILILTIILTLDQLNLNTSLLSAIALVIIAAIALALGLAFGLGNRSLARSIMAGFHAKEMFTPGQTLTVRNHTGRLASIGSTKSILETEMGQVTIPNEALISEDVLIAPSDKVTESEGAE